MPDNKPVYEIIEPEPPEEKPKRKSKRKYQPFFGHIPWRLVAFAFSAGIGVTIIAVIGYALITPLDRTIDITPTFDTPSSTELAPPFGSDSSMQVTALPQDFIRSAAWTGDSVVVVSAMQMKYYHRLDTPPTFTRFDLNSPFVQALASPDGQRIAAFYDVHPSDGTYTQLLMLDSNGALENPLEETRFTLSRIFFGNTDRMLAWSPDSKLLAAATVDGRLTLWDAAAGKLLSNIETDTTLAAVSLKFTPDQHLIAITRYEDISIGAFDHDELRIWDISSPSNPKLEKTFKLDNIYLMNAHFNQDGRYAAFMGQVPYVEIFDTQAGLVVGKIDIGVDTMPFSVTINDTGETVAFAYRQFNNPFPATTPLPGQPNGDRIELHVSRWKLDDGKFTSETLATRSDYLSLAGLDYMDFSQDDQSLSYLSFSDNHLYTWNIKTGDIHPAAYQ